MERSGRNVLQGTFCFQLFFSSTVTFHLQRWSSRGHILKSLVSKPQVLENCPVLDSKTALFFESLKLRRLPEKSFCRPCFFGDRLKIFLKTFFWITLASVSLASSILVLGLEMVCPQKGCSWPRIFLCSWPRALCL